MPGAEMKDAIHYTIIASDPAAHLFTVTVEVAAPAPDGQQFALPAWIPGSYMIREFARNIVQIRGETAEGQPVQLGKRDKHTWQAEPCKGPLTLTYTVYAWDLSVRAAHLDATHGFFNGTSVFLRAIGHESHRHILDIQRPEGERYQKWRMATALPEHEASRYGFGSYVAGDYDELIDHPVEMGDFALATFEAHGVPHDIVITGKVPNLDMARLVGDLTKICETQIALFEPKTKQAPMDRYVFMTLAVGDGYGGLEHRASTALICKRSDLPVKGDSVMSEGYRTYLGLCSHEYFHTWNVKRIKPAVFAPYELQQESYTPLLWLFEGFTSYYDDLTLARCGLIDEPTYLTMLGKTVSGVLRGSGRLKQSVAESSFDAWVKYYRQDENAPNSIVSYYTKGSLVALALDLTIRAGTRGKRSLDDVMRALWQRWGRDFYTPGARGGRGVTEEDVDALFDEVTGLKLRRALNQAVRGTEDIPLAKLLTPFGITLTDKRNAAKPSLGVRITREANDCRIANVYEGGPAHHAGASAGDIIVAIDGLRVTHAGGSNLDNLLARYRIGDTVVLHLFRRDELMTLNAELAADPAPDISLQAQAKPVGPARMRALWLAGDVGRG
jgi:predicted metalloprotease with PDZ domain